MHIRAAAAGVAGVDPMLGAVVSLSGLLALALERHARRGPSHQPLFDPSAFKRIAIDLRVVQVARGVAQLRLLVGELALRVAQLPCIA
ncbi:hypothetical protein SY91_03725 [Burkholderia cenocepacia]|nr:hypothetical protein SY91_03725 [Burkholderia cenocepacia]